MPRNARLKRSNVTPTNHWHLRIFRIRIEVVDIMGDVPDALFVHLRHPADPHTGEHLDEFCAVATAALLVDTPEGTPDPVRPFPFFRRNYIEVDVRSSADFLEFFADVQAQVCGLLTSLDELDDLELKEVVMFGEGATPSESLSGDAP